MSENKAINMIATTKKPQAPFLYKLKIALSIFLPLAFLINSVLWFFYYHEIKEEEKILETHTSAIINMQGKKIASNFDLIVSDLLFFASYSQLMDALEDGISDKRLISDFALFSRGSKIYDQIRIIDAKGMEVIRINQDKGRPVIVSEDQLQPKGDRYYFKDAFELDKKEIFISPLDLNIEHGMIEEPLKPMIRFGTPIFNRQGQKRGIVIFNYLGANLIQDIKDVAVASTGSYMLVNADGYWIIGRDAQDEWGFMYKDKKDRTMGNTYPAAWEKISASESGQFHDPEGLVTFATIYPLLEGWKSSAGSGEAFMPSNKMKKAKEYYWKIVSFIPDDIFLERVGNPINKYIYVSLISTLLLGIGAWLLAYTKVSKDIAEWELIEQSKKIEQAKFQSLTDEFQETKTDLSAKLTNREEILRAKYEELEKLNRAFVSRELRMVELKKEIAELKRNK